MTIHLSEDLEKPVRAEVLSGQFASPDDAVEEIVRDYFKRNREVRTDERFLLRSFLTFALFMVSGAGTVLWGCHGGDKAAIFPVVFFACLVLMFLCSSYIFIKLVFYYRCPRCHRRLHQLHEAHQAVRYDCPDCRIIWDLGWRRT